LKHRRLALMTAALVLAIAGCQAAAQPTVAPQPSSSVASDAPDATRVATLDEIRAAVERYGDEHPAEFAGWFVDHGARDTVVALFTDHVADHAAALGALVDDTSRLVVRRAAWTIRQLGDLQTRITADKAWFEAANAELEQAEVAVESNRVAVGVRTLDAAIGDRIAEHFTAAGMIEVTVTGKPIAGRPVGGIDGRLVDRDGDGIGDITISVASVEPGIPADHGDVAYGTGPDGRFHVDGLIASTYELRFIRVVSDTERDVIATTRVTVPGGSTVRVNVVASEP
jgi:hypothetical protein